MKFFLREFVLPVGLIAATGYGAWWFWPEYFDRYTLGGMPMSVLGSFLASVILGLACAFFTMTFVPWVIGRVRSLLLHP